MLHVRTDGKITFVVWTVIQEGYASERRRNRLCLRVKPKRRFPGRSVVGDCLYGFLWEELNCGIKCDDDATLMHF